MAIKAFEGGKVQLFDKDTGDFLSLGKVYVYEPGTTTLKTSYTTSALSVANANPVILDSYGRGEIWVSGNAKFLVQDASGGSEYEVDNYNRDASSSSDAYNLATNGSFENETELSGLPDNWTITLYTGGTQTLDTTVSTHGAQSLKFTSTGSGGGYATQTTFAQVSNNRTYLVRFALKSSVADVRNLVQVKWYDLDQVFISNSSVYDNSTTNPTSFTVQQVTVTAPATAAFAKLELYGCHSSDVTSGSTWYDAVEMVTNIFLEDTTDGAGAGPYLDLRRAVVRAANDLAGFIRFMAYDSAGNDTEFVGLLIQVLDGTNGSEDGAAHLRTMVAGTVGTRLSIAQGTYTPSAVGGDKGGDTFNAIDYYRNGTKMLTPLQMVELETGAVATGTTTIPVDDTIPQNTEGTQFMSLDITPKSATNILRISILAHLANSAGFWMNMSLFQDSTASALGSSIRNNPTVDTIGQVQLVHTMVAGTTSPTTFKVSCGSNVAGTTTFNGFTGARFLGGVMNSFIRIEEFAA